MPSAKLLLASARDVRSPHQIRPPKSPAKVVSRPDSPVIPARVARQALRGTSRRRPPESSAVPAGVARHPPRQGSPAAKFPPAREGHQSRCRSPQESSTSPRVVRPPSFFCERQSRAESPPESSAKSLPEFLRARVARQVFARVSPPESPPVPARVVRRPCQSRPPSLPESSAKLCLRVRELCGVPTRVVRRPCRLTCQGRPSPAKLFVGRPVPHAGR